MTYRSTLQWGLFIVLIGQWAHPSLAVNLQKICDGRPLGTLLPNPQDCNSYYVCQSTPSLTYCDVGLHFDRVNEVCNWPQWANCILEEVETDDSGEFEEASSIEDLEESEMQGLSTLESEDQEELPIASQSGTFKESVEVSAGLSVVKDPVDLKPSSVAVEISVNSPVDSGNILKVPVEVAAEIPQMKVLENSKIPLSSIKIEKVPEVPPKDFEVKDSISPKLDSKPVNVAVELSEEKIVSDQKPASVPVNILQVPVVVAAELSKPKPVVNSVEKVPNDVEYSMKSVEFSEVKDPISPKLPVNSVENVPNKVITKLSDTKIASNTKPDLEPANSLQVPVQVAEELSEVKASVRPKPQVNFVEKDSNDVNILSNTKPVLEPANTLQVPVDVTADLSEVRAPISPKLPENSVEKVSNEIPAELSEVKAPISPEVSINSVKKVLNEVPAKLSVNSVEKVPNVVPTEVSELKDPIRPQIPANSLEEVLNEAVSDVSDAKAPISPKPSSESGQTIKVPIKVAAELLETVKPPSNSGHSVQVQIAVPIHFEDLNQSSNFNKPSSIIELSPQSGINDPSAEEADVVVMPEPVKEKPQILIEEESEEDELVDVNKNQAQVIDLDSSTSDESIESESSVLTIEKVQVKKPSSLVIESFNSQEESKKLFEAKKPAAQVIELSADEASVNDLSQEGAIVEKVEPPISQLYAGDKIAAKKPSAQVIELTADEASVVGMTHEENIVEKVEPVQISQQGTGQVIEIVDAGQILKPEQMILTEFSEIPNELSLPVIEKVQSSSPQEEASRVIDISIPELPVQSQSALDSNFNAPVEKVNNPELNSVAINVDDQISALSSIDLSRPTPKSPLKKLNQFILMENYESEEDIESDEFTKHSKVKGLKLKKNPSQKKKTQITSSVEVEDYEDAEDSEEVVVPKHSTKKKQKESNSNSIETEKHLKHFKEEQNAISDETSQASEEDVIKPTHNKQKRKKKKASKKQQKESDEEYEYFSYEEKDIPKKNAEQHEKFVTSSSHSHSHHQKDATNEHHASKKPVNSEEREYSKKESHVPHETHAGHVAHQDQADHVVEVDNFVESDESLEEYTVHPVELKATSEAKHSFSGVKVNSREPIEVHVGQAVPIAFHTFDSNAVKVVENPNPNEPKVIDIGTQGGLIHFPLANIQYTDAIKVESAEPSPVQNLSGKRQTQLSAAANNPKGSFNKKGDQSNLSVSILSAASVRRDDPVKSPDDQPIVGAHNPQTGNPIEALTGYNADDVQCIYDGLYFLPHPNDCQKYFICAYRRLHLHSCGNGLTWSYKREQCQLTSQGVCYSKEIEATSVKSDMKKNPARQGNTSNDRDVTKNMASSTPMPPLRTTEKAKSTEKAAVQLPSCPTFRQAYLPHSDDCNKYYICILGQAVITSCPDGLFWDFKDEFCGHKSEVTCMH